MQGNTKNHVLGIFNNLTKECDGIRLEKEVELGHQKDSSLGLRFTLRIKEMLRIVTSGDFPGGPVVKTLPSNEDFPCGSTGKESTCSAGDLGVILGLERFPGVRNGYPL